MLQLHTHLFVLLILRQHLLVLLLILLSERLRFLALLLVLLPESLCLLFLLPKRSFRALELAALVRLQPELCLQLSD